MPSKRSRKLNFRIGRGDPALAPGELLLEMITPTQLRASRLRGEQISEYQSRQFYELEAQRVTHQDKIRSALQSVAGISVPLDGWCRSIKLCYSHVPLSCVGSLKQSGRFHYGADLGERFPAFPALYLAADRPTAHCEMVGYTRKGETTNGFTAEELAMQSATSIAWLAISGVVNNVFDLTQPKNLKPFVETTKGFKFTSDFRKFERACKIRPVRLANTTAVLVITFMDPAWRAVLQYADVPANGQVFGQLVASAGFDGIKYRSTRTRADALVVFPRNLSNGGSVVRVTDSAPGSQCTELNADTHADAEREQR
ncbi:RES family NAD+ phosphorylase [Povalibacter sp.]|uniref:RES family NAD+ phosphorylase n=1 Tax=Povalibacter sp. TaxID=1962978 RepID=UPI002F415491